MKKTVKAEIKSSVSKALAELLQHLRIAKPSRKTRKAIARVEKSLREDVKTAMKKEIKNATKVERAKDKGVAA
jgi:hypothetical protein